MSRYVIGDVHGGAQTLKCLLGRIGLRRGDRLYFLGDLIDRGPDSRGVLDILINLKAAGYDVRPIRGNHEDMLLRTISGDHDTWSADWMETAGANTLKSFEIERPEALPVQYHNFLSSLPLLALEPDYVIVHAGLAFEAADPIRDSPPSLMLWHEYGVPDRTRMGGRVAITGHKYQPMQVIEASLRRDRIFLDNGAYTGRLPELGMELGNLVALDLDRVKLIVQPWVDDGR